MIILTIRTDKPEAEIGLYNNDQQLVYQKWQGHRELSTTILEKIEQLLDTQKRQWKDIEGIVGFKGPGSFTGLRIGLTVANMLASDLSVPIVGEMGDEWVEQGLRNLAQGENQKLILPEYGREAHITKQKR